MEATITRQQAVEMMEQVHHKATQQENARLVKITHHYETLTGEVLIHEAQDIRDTVADFRRYLRDCGSDPRQLQGVAEELCKVYLHAADFLERVGLGQCDPAHLPTA